ncbi:MAG: CapA family protein [Acidimicrobiia bacterium]|nr:CapA family protein [Acidimicrobiia bacterium]
MPGRAANPKSRRAIAGWLVALGLATGACAPAAGELQPIQSIQDLPASTITLQVIDEIGIPLRSANLEVEGRGYAATEAGTIAFVADQPVMGTVSAPDHLTMPIVLTPEMEPTVTVRLLRRLADDGTPRIVLHFAGDTMMGRRYQEPTRADTPVVTTTDQTAAQSVVSDVAELFGGADISSLNFESVIGTLPSSAAYPGKRFLLQSPPSVIAALEALGTDVATLGNNHLNDWQSAGVASTLRYLAEAGIAAPGAGSTDEEARAHAAIDVFGVRVAYLSYTTVTGDFVNDSLPRTGVAPPDDVAGADAWQWATQPFGFGTAADEVPLSIGEYRPGDVWAWFREAERTLTADQAAAAWASMIEVYPELQDWVARRDHGGAAWFRSAAVDADVAAARDAGADLVVVQLHGGFQFAEVASQFLTSAAHASIDAGADLVVGHHPHVLQGFEWYRDRLIAYSLGNFVFDQDFLSTFSSAVLRTVFEGDRLVEARIFPLTLDSYRPVPLAGEAADRLLRMLNVRSAGTLQSVRMPDRTIGNVVVETGSRPAAIVEEHGSGWVTIAPDPETVALTTGDDGTLALPPDTMLQASVVPSTWFGRDLFGYGSFEDVLADGLGDGGVHWALDPTSETARLVRDPSIVTGNYYVSLSTRDTYTRDVVVRPIARVTPIDHRISDADGNGLDGRPEYSVRLKVRRTGVTEPFFRIDAYHFFDADPTEDPESTLLRQMQVTIDVPADGNWHELDVAIPAAVFANADGMRVNAALIYLGVPPPVKGATDVAFDDIKIIEWRAVAQLPPGTWHAVDVLRTNSPGMTVELSKR